MKQKISVSSIVLFFSFAPAMTNAEKIAGCLWAGTALGAGVGSVISSFIVMASIAVDEDDVESLNKVLKLLEENVRSAIVETSTNSLALIKLLGIAGGVVTTIALAPLSILSLYQAVKNFREAAQSPKSHSKHEKRLGAHHN